MNHIHLCETNDEMRDIIFNVTLKLDFLIVPSARNKIDYILKI